VAEPLISSCISPPPNLKELFMNIRFSASLLLLFISQWVNSQKEDLHVSSAPQKVLVYISGAQIEAKANASLKAGVQTIVFDKLSNYIVENSVQVKADADITIMSVNYQLNYLQPQDKKEYKVLDDSVLSYRQQLARLAVTKRGYDEELSMLASNKSIGGANVGVNVNELQKMADFIRLRVQETALKKLETEEKERRLTERITIISQQLNELRNSAATPTGEVVVMLDSRLAGPANFELSYYASNCGWVPMYDVRVKDVNSQAKITAKANVFQSTGQEWKNVKLSLCTGNPSRGNTKPVINPWWISLSDPVVYRQNYKEANSRSMMEGDAERPAAAPARMEDMKSLEEVQVMSNSASSYTEVNPNATTNSIFDINIPYTINSNGKDNIIEIQEYSVDAKYSYFAIPKQDQDAFLVTDLIGWDKNELLPGEANVYFENNYVGKSYFDSRLIDDTLSFALGRDNNITIKRKQVKDLNEKTTISGNTKKITRSFEIDVKNTRKSAIVIELEDQVPLSNNAELVVELVDGSDAVYDKSTGKLTWKLTMNPGEAKKLKFSYTVKYPKKYILNGM